MGNLLRALAGDHPKQWDQHLPQAELAFNCTSNRSTGCAPFIASYGHLPKNVMDVTSEPSINKTTEEIVENSTKIHKQIEASISRANKKIDLEDYSSFKRVT